MRRLGIALLVLLSMPVAAAISFELAARCIALPPLTRLSTLSPTTLDSEGAVMRAFLAKDGKWRLPAQADDVPSHYLQMLVAYEDKRFYRHSGVDPLAIVRALAQMAWNGRVVSGGSTITMQVVRLLERGRRGLVAKFFQMLAARRLEIEFDKMQILQMYLTLAPFGGNIEGVRAASLAYFRKEPHALNLRQSALLIALPQSPERRRPDRNIHEARNSAAAVLRRSLQGGAISEQAWEKANSQSIGDMERATLIFLAPHFSDWLRRLQPSSPSNATSIDAGVQRYAERLAAEMLASLPPSVNVAIVVVRNSNAAIIGYVGGADYGAEGRAGQVDLVQALRSPGSTLKPFIYGLGFELLVVHPYTIVTDAPVGFGNYAPQNFAGDYAGDLTIRDALIRSINTGAVALLRRIGPQRLISRLRVAGLPLEIQETDAAAGLAIGLGGAGVRLLDLVRAYSALANRGISHPLRILVDDPTHAGTKLMDADAAWAVTDILADMPPPTGFVRPTSDDGGRRIAYKTGTSYAFRDAWAVGYDALHTVGVWVGRPDGAPHVGAYGATAAAPLLFRLFEMLPRPDRDVAGPPPHESILSARQPPERLVRFDTKPLAASLQPLRIAFPQDGSTVVAQATPSGSLTLPLIVQGGMPPYQLYLDDLALDRPHFVGRIAWIPQGRGAAKLVVTDTSGSRAEVKIWVEEPPSDATPPTASAGSMQERQSP